MTDFSLGARLHLGANSNRAFSLPQSFVAAKRRQKPAPSSEGAEAATAAEHRFSFVVKVRSKRYTVSRIQPLSLFGLLTSRKASSPYTGEPRSALRSPCRAQGSREVRSVRLAEHRGAEKRAPFALRSTREPRFALRSPFGKKMKFHHNFAFWGDMIFAE